MCRDVGRYFIDPKTLYILSLYTVGDPEEHPQKESYWGHVNPTGPRACYDEGKRVSETMCYAYAQQVYHGICGVSFISVHGIKALLQSNKYFYESIFFVSKGGVDVRVARIFNTFGPRMHPHDGRVVSNFIIQALKGNSGVVLWALFLPCIYTFTYIYMYILLLLTMCPGEPITVYGDGSQTRSFQYVEVCL